MKTLNILFGYFPLSLRERGLIRASSSVVAMLLASVALTGCASNILESKVDEPQVYVLRTGNVGTATVAYPIQLGIALPAAAPGLDTNRIALLRNNNQLDYYFGARWGGTAPQVVQTFLIDTMQAQQGFKSIATESARIDAEYLLELQLKDFQAEYTGEDTPPVVKITLGGNLISIKTRKLVASVNSASSVTASDNRLGAVVTAFQTAMQQISAEISSQLAAAAAK